MLDEVYAASDVLKIHPTRINAFAATQTGPLAALVEDRVVPMTLPVRDAMVAAKKRLSGTVGTREAPVAVFWMSLDETGRMMEAVASASDHLGYKGAVIGAMGGGHTPERAVAGLHKLAVAIPTVMAPRAGGGPLLRRTYGGPSSEIELQKAGLLWGGRLHPLKSRVLLETCLRAGLSRAAIGEVFAAFG
jgi:L-asparaginase